MRVHAEAESLSARLDNMRNQFGMNENNEAAAEDMEFIPEEEDNVPEAQAPEPNAFDPGFLEQLPANENAGQDGTPAQQAAMLEAVADSRDERTHRKLTEGVRPGEFFEGFTSLGKIIKSYSENNFV
jgi:hypothetical protein